MGSVDKYCPHCGSEKVFKVELEFESDCELEFEGADLWYECGDCHSEWEPHHHSAAHTFFGTA